MEMEGEDIVLKAFLHCEGCSEQVSKCLRVFEGVEQVVVDRENQKVIVKGKKAEPLKVLKRLRKKYSKNVDLISPRIDPHRNNTEDAQQKKQPPLKTVILKSYIHCECCASDVHRSLEKMKGVVSVDVNKEESQIVVRGVVNAIQLVQHVKSRLGKHAEVISQLAECCSCCCPRCKREAENLNECQDTNGNENVIMFPSCPPSHQLSCQAFSDENVFSCSLM
ncbi:heavy metal-associated isoprenylated plant protein 8-like [Neltuma alba]|uniref:heavy metal-associated isoprenylated plant protein 8-like n=1 Tax=Neltuma alba TaxID=207710 RepID=UPI0010A2E6CD|nr:heavy metal-associated isoprenylated plant protein 8-like [Prosopis alba]